MEGHASSTVGVFALFACTPAVCNCMAVLRLFIERLRYHNAINDKKKPRNSRSEVNGAIGVILPLKANGLFLFLISLINVARTRREVKIIYLLWKYLGNLFIYYSYFKNWFREIMNWVVREKPENK